MIAVDIELLVPFEQAVELSDFHTVHSYFNIRMLKFNEILNSKKIITSLLNKINLELNSLETFLSILILFVQCFLKCISDNSS